RIARRREDLSACVAREAALVVVAPLVAEAELRVGAREGVEELSHRHTRTRRGEDGAVDLRRRPDTLAQLLRRRSERDDARHGDVEAVSLGGRREEREAAELLVGRKRV